MSVPEQHITQENELSHILIVDDETANCELLKRTLGKTYRVTCVPNGKAALDILNQESVDTVLLDIMMPQTNGLDVLRQIRDNAATADLPVILISALSDGSDIVRGLGMGANDYLTKPSSANIVQARVNTQVTLKRLIDRHKQVIAELKMAKETRDRFFRMASHDLKAPLANIRMTEYILRSMVENNEEGNKVLDMMVKTVENMQEVIEEFLELAPVQSGNIELKIEALDVRNAVMDTVVQFYAAATNKNIQIEVGNLPGTIKADPARFQQIIGNLVSNAIKYSPHNRTVTLWSEHLGQHVRINVADQGPGIPDKERHLLFKEFGRLSTRPTGNESSTGLGLWSVKQLVLLHNGDLGVDCPADGGSIFWISLPAIPPE